MSVHEAILLYFARCYLTTIASWWKQRYIERYTLAKVHIIAKSQTKRVITQLPIYHHVIRNSVIGLILIAVALYIGMVGYHVFEHMSWIDSFLNASMILSGMGPATALVSAGGKLFAGFYALFSGLAFIAIVVIVFSPAIHQFFRKIHLESNQDLE